MKKFIPAALPFVIIGVCVVIIMVHYKRKDEYKKENCLVEGMCIGMCLEVVMKALSWGLYIVGIGLCIAGFTGHSAAWAAAAMCFFAATMILVRKTKGEK